MTKEKKETLIQELAQTATDNVDMKTLVRMYYDDQYGYLSGLDDDELAEHIEATQELDEETKKLIIQLKG